MVRILLVMPSSNMASYTMAVCLAYGFQVIGCVTDPDEMFEISLEEDVDVALVEASARRASDSIEGIRAVSSEARIVLVATHTPPVELALESDEILYFPFLESDLNLLVRRLVKTEAPTLPPPG